LHGTIDSQLTVEWRPLAALSSIAAQWKALADRALAPNVFYEPAFALAAAPALGRDVGAALVWSRCGEPQLLGLFPACIDRRRYGVPVAVLSGWTHPYAPLGAPLIERERGETVIGSWLDYISGNPRLPDIVLLPFLPLGGALASALEAAIARRGGHSKAFGRHCRALLDPAGTRTGYLNAAIGVKRRKELRRLRNRLGESGALGVERTSDPVAVTRALDHFLDLECRGWKGRAGTAARSRPEICGFMQSAVTGLAAEGRAQVDCLHLDGRPIAATVTLRSSGSAWVWKIAYDESFARFSPGVQHMLGLTQAMLDDPGITRADSCATADHPMIDHIWHERLVVADVLLCPSAASSSRFALACGLEGLRRAGIRAAKAVRKLGR
jgi:CelD/BcsL family acetyltransferase involved in cellulose biosynthesis